MGETKAKDKVVKRARRHARIRGRIHGTAERPRLNIYRSVSNIYAQVINDDDGRTIVSASTIDNEVAAQVEGKTKVEAARIVGRMVAERARNAGVEAVTFDRGGYKYHGRIAALAEGAREGGLKF
ncbi:MAG: 50S ribosomal protein L18 [bacterium]|nr:50S ribosomal protein L18 [bacterium]